MANLIDRQAAINSPADYIHNVDRVLGTGHLTEYECKDAATSVLEDLPSAEPESLTDKEQRIFLSAMERERKVCRQVDEEWRNMREPYEESLVHVCNEIERKVKGALWI